MKTHSNFNVINKILHVNNPCDFREASLWFSPPTPSTGMTKLVDDLMISYLVKINKKPTQWKNQISSSQAPKLPKQQRHQSWTTTILPANANLFGTQELQKHCHAPPLDTATQVLTRYRARLWLSKHYLKQQEKDTPRLIPPNKLNLKVETTTCHWSRTLSHTNNSLQCSKISTPSHKSGSLQLRKISTPQPKPKCLQPEIAHTTRIQIPINTQSSRTTTPETANYSNFLILLLIIARISFPHFNFKVQSSNPFFSFTTVSLSDNQTKPNRSNSG